VKVFQSVLQNNDWSEDLPKGSSAQMVLAFGSRQSAQDTTIRAELKSAFPHADIIGCTTSGEISGIQLYDNSLCITAVSLEKTPITLCSGNISDFSDSYVAGKELAKQLPQEDLRHVFVLSDGQLVNGSLLVQGLAKHLPENVVLTGGMAGDGERFEKTWVWHNDRVESGLIVICGFYGDAIRIGHGSLGGWDSFGPDRVVTRSEGNILYELDDQSALTLYKEYLGDYAKELPASALLFPLSVHKEGEEEGVVRTILNINEDDQSMIFAGDIPQGAYARLMRANFDRLIDGANSAAEHSQVKLSESSAELGILVSCVGRRLVLKQRTEEELEAVEDVLGSQCSLCGFYSYGEISPMLSQPICSLHNQTMTITTFAEVMDA